MGTSFGAHCVRFGKIAVRFAMILGIRTSSVADGVRSGKIIESLWTTADALRSDLATFGA